MRYPYVNENVPTFLIAVCVVFVAVCVLLHFALKKNIKVSKYVCFGALLVTFVLRIVVIAVTDSHADITTFFLPWSKSLVDGNFFEFYLSDPSVGTIDRFHDYPPMLMYLLWLIGKVVRVLGLSDGVWIFLMRIPACVCDVVCGYYILKIAVAIEKSKVEKPIAFERRKDRKLNGGECEKGDFSVGLKNFPNSVGFFAFACMVMYMLNPAMITDSAWWGQVDGVIAMFLAITIYNVVTGKDTAVVVTAILALCYKLQYIFFMPALGMYYLIRLASEKKELFAKLLKGVVIGGIIFVVINLPLCAVPMAKGHPLFMLQIYVNQVSNYSYYTLNAPNLFGALNKNFEVLPNNGTAWTLFVLIAVSGIVAGLSFRGEKENKISVLGAFTIITVFIFSYKMHERYMIYALVLLLIVYLQSGKLADLLVYCGFTCIQFVTIGSLMCINGSTFDFFDKRLQIISLICLTIYIGYVILISQAEITARESQSH